MSFTVETKAELLSTARPAQFVASATIRDALATWALISWIEAQSSSIAAATPAAFAVVSPATVDAMRAWRCESNHTDVIPRAQVSSSVAACSTAPATVSISVSSACATLSRVFAFRAADCSRSAARAAEAARSATALSRNTATARAMAPISSRRSRPSIPAPRSPSAMRVMVPAIRCSGRAMKRCPSNSATISAAVVPPAKMPMVIR